MTTLQFLNALLNWLLADPVHLTFAAGVVAMITPTPNPATWAGKAYRVLDIFALNFLRAKETGKVDPAVAQQVAALQALLKSATEQAATTAVSTPNQEQTK